MRPHPDRPPDRRSVLFVCTANITRSPAAAALFRKTAAERGARWRVGSAGVRAVPGLPPEPVVANYLNRRWGLDIFSHRSQPLTPALTSRHYWLIGMETAHKAAILELNPDAVDRTFTLRELGRDAPVAEPDVPDPTGLDFDGYARLFQLLAEEIPRIYQVLELKI